jgi:hypothetical protein
MAIAGLPKTNNVLTCMKLMNPIPKVSGKKLNPNSPEAKAHLAKFDPVTMRLKSSMPLYDRSLWPGLRKSAPSQPDASRSSTKISG